VVQKNLTLTNFDRTKKPKFFILGFLVEKYILSYSQKKGTYFNFLILDLGNIKLDF
jgi:hypothetical protein